MAHRLDIQIPTRLRFWRAPVRWTLLKSDSGALFTGEIEPVKPTEIDGDQYWKEFLALPEGDETALFELLSKVGLWEADSSGLATAIAKKMGVKRDEKPPNSFHFEAGGRLISSYVPPVESARLWGFRKMLTTTLPSRKRFIASFAAADEVPDAFVDRNFNQFSSRFELDSKQPGLVLNTVSLREMILAINYRDFARGANYQLCQREDCPQPLFTVTGNRKRLFCSWYCGHLVSVRKRREKQRAKRR